VAQGEKVIANCEISAEEVAVLEGVVPDFQWDHDERDREDEDDDFYYDSDD